MRDNDDTLAQEEAGLDELAAPAPDENPSEDNLYQHSDLESARGHDEIAEEAGQQQQGKAHTLQWLTQLYIVSYLVLFSIFGVLARIGLQALTVYPGALVPNTDLWANVGGSFLMGYLREDRLLFRRHWKKELENARRKATSDGDESLDGEDGRQEAKEQEIVNAARESFSSSRSIEVPAFVGLTVGFCGSFTSFASICRDVFLAIANKVDTAVISTQITTGVSRGRSDADSLMAALAVLILEVGLSTIALICGAHLSTSLAFSAEKIPVFNLSRIMNPLSIVLGFGCWLGTILMTIWPVDDVWRGRVLFSLVFAPVGCLLRFQLSLRLNKLLPSFPLGTFAANILGICVLGMCFDLQMSPVGSAIVSCQILQGFMDGFCGALTTVSTWVLELDTLKLKHAYTYGGCSIFVGVGFITAIMGSVKWTSGFTAPTCST